MRIFIGLGALAAILAADIQTAGAQNRPWCWRTGFSSLAWCGYDTFAQCEATRREQGGSCVQNYLLAAERPQEAARNERPGSDDADSHSTFVSWLSSKVAELTGSRSTEPEQSAATPSVPTPQAEAPPQTQPQTQPQPASRGERVAVAGTANAPEYYYPRGDDRPHVSEPRLSPWQAMRIVRSAGFAPLSAPVLHGPNYVVTATGRHGYVRVLVNASEGEIVGVRPAIAVRLNDRPAPYGPRVETPRVEQARAPAKSPQQSAPQAAARAEAPAPEVGDAAKEALFREFMQWRVKQLFLPES